MYEFLFIISQLSLKVIDADLTRLKARRWTGFQIPEEGAAGPQSQLQKMYFFSLQYFRTIILQ